MDKPSLVDLFCGCGGLAWGFEEQGFTVLLGADVKSVALGTFARNFPQAIAMNEDLSRYSPRRLMEDLGLKSGELDCLVGGPPCQGFSKNVPARHRFLDDPKNQLVLTFLEFVKVFKPKVLLLENVAEMVNAYEQVYTSEALGLLERLGYEAGSTRLLATDYGVPQLRRRAFFFANRIGASVRIPEPTYLAPGENPGLFNWETARRYVTVWEAISDLPPLKSGEGSSPCEYATEPKTEYQRQMRKGSTALYDHVARSLTKPQLDRVKHLRPGSGEGADALPMHLRPRKRYSGAYARLKPEEPARTITRWVFHPGSGRYYHPYDNRVITIREAARLQSFPDNFVFEGTYIQKASQIGEAVPPLLSQAFARETKSALLGESVSHLGHKVR
jgi:DNA (cytosine-5)-methyltransferase 1